eukprot:6089449-Pleurochrysis_carterae.AAC.1
MADDPRYVAAPSPDPRLPLPPLPAGPAPPVLPPCSRLSSEVVPTACPSRDPASPAVVDRPPSASSVAGDHAPLAAAGSAADGHTSGQGSVTPLAAAIRASRAQRPASSASASRCCWVVYPCRQTQQASGTPACCLRPAPLPQWRPVAPCRPAAAVCARVPLFHRVASPHQRPQLRQDLRQVTEAPHQCALPAPRHTAAFPSLRSLGLHLRQQQVALARGAAQDPVETRDLEPKGCDEVPPHHLRRRCEQPCARQPAHREQRVNMYARAARLRRSIPPPTSVCTGSMIVSVRYAGTGTGSASATPVKLSI